MRTCRAILFGFLSVSLLSIPGVCAAQDGTIADFRVSLTAEYTGSIGRIKASARWKNQGVSAIYFRLVYQGRTIAASSRGRMSATGYAEYWLCSYEEFRVLKEDYFSSPHTFTLEAVGNYGDGETCSSYTYVPADILRIENRVAGLADMPSGALEVSHHPDANEGPDACDVAYHVETRSTAGASVTSVRTDPNTAVQDRLVVDARPKESVSDVDLLLSLESETAGPVQFASARSNELRLSLPRQSRGYDFRPSPLTLQQYDPLHPSVKYAIHDVRKVVSANAGIVWLPPLKGSYGSGTPYAHLRLSFTKAVSADLSGDGVVDLRDFAVSARDWRGSAVPTIADMAGPKGPGVPDGNVNASDLMAFCRKWAGDADGFESGGFDNLGWFGAGDAYWTIASSESHSGFRCAQAGRIEDNQQSRLMITIDCRAGEVSFWRKVSSEERYDFLRFRSGGTALGEWSGELDWERVSFTVEAGTRTFSWEYIKDSAGAMGSDTAWIDLVSFPTSALESSGR